MQISKLYETKLECSSYNVNIDSTDTTVTLTLVDFNGSPVTNTAVTLKADKGYFTKAVGKTTTTYTDASATKTINATTDNNGKVVATWTASEWGLCTFSANNTTIAVTTSGWRTILNQSGITFYVNEYSRTAMLRIYLLNKSFNNTDYYWLTTNGNITQSNKPQIIAEPYRPVTDTVVLSIFGRTNISGLLIKNTSDEDVAGTIKFIRDPAGTQNIHAFATWGF